MQKITPFLWFDDNAEEAMNFYISVFKNSKAVEVRRNPDGKAFTAIFRLEGQEFYALNGGPQYKFNPAVSFFVNCESQQEIDYYWDKLTSGGKEIRCGWLVDKFGISWQIVPSALGRMLSDPKDGNSKKVMEAMLKMVKLDIKALEQAYRQK